MSRKSERVEDEDGEVSSRRSVRVRKKIKFFEPRSAREGERASALETALQRWNESLSSRWLRAYHDSLISPCFKGDDASMERTLDALSQCWMQAQKIKELLQHPEWNMDTLFVRCSETPIVRDYVFGKASASLEAAVAAVEAHAEVREKKRNAVLKYVIPDADLEAFVWSQRLTDSLKMDILEPAFSSRPGAWIWRDDVVLGVVFSNGLPRLLKALEFMKAQELMKHGLRDFDHPVLCHFCARFVTGALDEEIFDSAAKVLSLLTFFGMEFWDALVSKCCSDGASVASIQSVGEKFEMIQPHQSLLRWAAEIGSDIELEDLLDWSEVDLLLLFSNLGKLMEADSNFLESIPSLVRAVELCYERRLSEQDTIAIAERMITFSGVLDMEIWDETMVSELIDCQAGLRVKRNLVIVVFRWHFG
jgi:hypothetical protein